MESIIHIKIEQVKIVIFIVILFFNSCTTQQKQEKSTNEETSEIPVLEVSSNLSVSLPDTFTWNNVAKSTRLIPLSSKTLLGTSLSIVDINSDMIVVADNQRNRITYFDMDGNLISSFQHVGQGPGEYKYLSFVHFNEEDSTIFVYDNGNMKVLLYSLSGKCLKELSVKDRNWGQISRIDKDGRIYMRNSSEANSFVSILDRDWEVQQEFFPFDSLMTERQINCIKIMSNRSNTNDLSLLNQPSSDTVFSITKEGALPVCIVKKGIHALTLAECENFLKLPDNNNYLTYTSIDIFPPYLLFRYRWQGKFTVDLWDMEKQKKIGVADLVQPDMFTGLIGGFNYTTESGKQICLLPDYITKERLAFLIPAEKCVGEIVGVKEDDNPVLMIMELK